jgi:F420H2 dehydrogenase subunit B
MDELNDNETVENQEGYVEEIPGVITTTSMAITDFLKKTKAQDVINWGRKNSLWFLT